MLFLDGKLIGPTPKKAPTTPGQHELRLVLDGYKVWSAPTRLPDKPGFELRVAVNLKPVREAEAYEAPAALELARAQYKRADACYAAKNYSCAASGYQAAYDYSKKPELLFNVELVGDVARDGDVVDDFPVAVEDGGNRNFRFVQ